MNRYSAILIALAILVIGVAMSSGCTPSGNPPDGASESGDEALPVPEAVVAASTGDEFPDYVYKSAMALRGYQIATSEQELIAKLPCYCGCGQDPDYASLLDCFLDPSGGFRSHGANCQVCLEEAEDAATWKSEGLSTMEIRGRIDAAYEGRGQPTDTPPVLN